MGHTGDEKLEDVSALSEQETQGYVIRGRLFCSGDVDLIRVLVETHYEEGRTRISQEVCRSLDWRQPNGWLKERACRDVLLRLQHVGEIALPPKKANPINANSGKGTQAVFVGFEVPAAAVSVLREPLRLDSVKGTRREGLWNRLVDEHHYLRYRPTVGRHVKYLVRSGTTVVGAVSFSSPAWKLQARDAALRALDIEPDEIPNCVINNGRFLVLPAVQVPNLASRILALTTRRVVQDWEDYYSVTPVVAETFVDPSLFAGTCYRAANWIRVGQTRGYAKAGSMHVRTRRAKEIYLYGLRSDIRRKLAIVSRGGQA